MRGRNNVLYFPYGTSKPDGKCRGYRLSSPSNSNVQAILHAGPTSGSGGPVIEWEYPMVGDYVSIRPVVCIPSNLLEYNSTMSSWDINLSK